jgi:amino acid permease
MEQQIALIGIFILSLCVIGSIAYVTQKTISMNANIENQHSTRRSLMPIVTVVLIASGAIVLILLGKISESGGISILSGIVGYVLGNERK